MFKDYGNKGALITENKILLYGELNKECDSFQQSISERCLIFILCTNSVASIVGYVSCINNNIVPVLLDANLDTDMLLSLLEKYKPKYLWLPNDKKDTFSDYTAVYEYDGYMLLATGNADINLHPDLALLMTTSGSTGSPKLVRLSYENLRSNTSSIVKYLELTENDRTITNLPMYYVYGLSIINTHLSVGASIVVTEHSFFQREFWQLFKEHEVTNFGGVPYTYEMLTKLRFERMKLPALRLLTQAGGKLSPELHAKYAEYATKQSKKFVVMYGASEATARMGYLPADKSLDKVGYMGNAIPGGRFELLSESGEVITDSNVEGELIYYGPNVSMGYASSCDDLSKGDENNGRLITGDIALCDGDGYYKITGRKKRFLKLFGKRTNLEEVEQLLKRHYISDIACGGVDDKLYIFYVDAEIGDGIISYISEKLGLHFSAFKAVQLAEIPKNEAGKTMYRELSKYYDL